jgi:formylglycine-generating enzyme required for sulfatase activity
VEVRFLIVAMIAIPMFSQAPAEPKPAFEVASVKAQIPEGMALIPGITTQMGIDEDEVPHFQQIFHINQPRLFQDVIPKHSVTLESFYIDKKLATNAEFKKFVDRNPKWQKDHIHPNLHNGEYLREWAGNAYPGSKAEHPMVNVSWYAAVAYCRWQGKRLPTEAEWELAARGNLQRPLFPWGDELPDGSRANYAASELKATTPVGMYSANGFEIFDMAGNVWEFTADAWNGYSNGLDSATHINLSMSGNEYLDVTSRRVIRGGSWGGSPVNLWVEYRDSHPPNGARDFVGFRCAESARDK